MTQIPPPGKPLRKDHKGRAGDPRHERNALTGQHAPDADADVEALPVPEGPTEIISTDYEIGQDNIEGRK